MNAAKKRGRPLGSTNAAKVEADDDFKQRMIRGAYTDPGSSLGRTAYLRELIRDKAMADTALANASAALLKVTMGSPSLKTNHLGIQCTVAALTRVSEVAATYPEDMRVRVTSARERLERARQEVKDSAADLAEAEEAELEWIEAAVKSVTPDSNAPEPTVLWREKRA
jgi:hypothetical protein